MQELTRTFTSYENAVKVAKEFFWLAWQAAGSPGGMGWFQNNPAATKEDVWSNAVRSGDYPGARTTMPEVIASVYADYVFGRMLKTGLRVDGSRIRFYPAVPRIDYQAWCGTYPTVEALLDAACAAAGVEEKT